MRPAFARQKVGVWQIFGTVLVANKVFRPRADLPGGGVLRIVPSPQPPVGGSESCWRMIEMRSCRRQWPRSKEARDSLGFLLAGNDLLPKCVRPVFEGADCVTGGPHWAGTESSPGHGAGAGVGALLAEAGDGDEHACCNITIGTYVEVDLLIGRRNGCAGFMTQRKGEPDARVRANSIEGLWNAGDQSPRRVLWPGDRTNPRNGPTSGAALPCVGCLGHGEAADASFLPPLRCMLTDKDKTVRARALRSLASIRSHRSQPA